MMSEPESLSPVKVKRFMRHMIRAINKNEQRKDAHVDLGKQISKIKEMAPKGKLQKEIKQLEEKLNRVLSISLHESQNTDFLRGEIKNLETDVSSLKDHDSELIDTLRDQIFVLENDIRKAEFQHQNTESKNKLEIENISKAIVDLRERIKNDIEARQEREKRITELEERIKAKVSENLDEIIKLEKHLEVMEEKYEFVKKEGKYDTTLLQSIEDKINKIKYKLKMRRAGITPAAEKPLPKIKLEMPIAKQKEVPVIRHDLHFAPIPEFKKQKTEEKELPAPEEHKLLGIAAGPVPKKEKPMPLPPIPPPEFKEGKKPYDFTSSERMKSLEQLEDYKPGESLFDKIKKAFKPKPKTL